MKKLILLFALVGCGIAEDITESRLCDNETDLFCDVTFGNDIQDRIDQIEDDQELTEQGIYDLQIAINDLQQQLIEATSGNPVVEYIDPCGDDPNNYDEILMRTSNGKLIAYFQSDNRRFLTILEPGSYVTTDRQRCRFTVTPSLEVVY